MTTTFAQAVEEEELFVRRQAEEAIKVLFNVREGRKAFEAEEKAARTIIDAFFLSHPDEAEIVDPEAGYRAYLRSGGTTKTYDVPAAIQKANKELYTRLKTLGVFKLVIDTGALEKAVKDGLVLNIDLAPFVKVGERTPSLMVERIEK